MGSLHVKVIIANAYEVLGQPFCDVISRISECLIFQQRRLFERYLTAMKSPIRVSLRIVFYLIVKSFILLLGR